MWLFTSNGFVSVVADKNDPTNEKLLVRSRDRNHIRSLFPLAKVFSVPLSDYQWRAWVSRDQVTEVVSNNIQNLNYTNFKNSIESDMKYHDACLSVWNSVFNEYYYTR
jgi:hypothetical protein